MAINLLVDGQVLGDLYIEGDSTPKLVITDTTNTLVGRIRVGNTAMYIDADSGAGVSNTSMQFQIDDVTKLQLTESISRFSAQNVSIRRDDTVPVLNFERNDATIVAGNDLGQLIFKGADPSSFNEGGRISAEADGTWDTDVYPTRFKFDVKATDTLQTALRINSDAEINFSQYGSGTFTGTAAYNLQIDSSGNIIESTADAGGSVTSVTGTTPIVSSGGTTPAISINNATGTTVGAAAIDAGTGISVSDSSGVYTITNTGVTSIVAGTGISVSGATGAVTVTNSSPATIDGSGAANQVAYWSDSDTLTGSNDLTYNGTTLALAGDNEVLQIGTGGTGTTSLYAWTGDTFYIQNDSAGGTVQVDTDSFVVKNHGASENIIIGNADGAVKLYYNASNKLETTNTGIDISGGFTTSASSDCAGLNMTADLAMNGNILTLDSDGNIELDCALSASQSSGTIIKFGGQMSGLTYGRPAYLYNSGASELWAHVSNVNWSNVTKMLAIPLGTTASSDGMLLNGIYYSATHGLTPGAPAYIGDNTLGSLSNTAPSGSGDVVRVVGYAIDENHIYFCPDNTWVEID